MLSLNIIGAGKVAKVMGRLFADHQVFRVSQIVSTHKQSAEAALDFIGTGEIAEWTTLRPAHVTMLAVPDDQIIRVSEALQQHKLSESGSIVFHCSGSKSSVEMRSALTDNVSLASVHPVCSFADLHHLARNFAGTMCSIEGDVAALEVLIPAIQKIAAEVLPLSAENKLLYHAGAVYSSNYLVSLIETALQTYQAAGVPLEVARTMSEALVRQTVDNVFKFGTADALTGPIQRADWKLVEQQQRAIDAWDTQAGALYSAFTPVTRRLAEAQRCRKNLSKE